MDLHIAVLYGFPQINLKIFEALSVLKNLVLNEDQGQIFKQEIFPSLNLFKIQKAQTEKLGKLLKYFLKKC